MQAIKTDAQVRAAKVGAGSARTELKVDGVPGLRLRVTASSKVFRMTSRKTGSITIGEYPTISLAEARSAALELLAKAERRKIEAGGYVTLPARDKRTLQDVLDGFEQDRGAAVRSWPLQRQAIELRYGDLLSEPVRKIDRDRVLDPVRRDRIVAAKRAAAYLSIVLRWAGAGEPVSVRVLDDLVPEQPRDRILTTDEIGRVLSISMNRTMDDFVQALFLTMQRRGDVAAMRWEDVDRRDGIWRLRVQKRRKRVAVSHPLSRQMRELLDRRAAAYGSEGLIFPSKTGTVINNWNRLIHQIRTATDTDEWTFHDIRRTCRTLMGRAAVPPHIAERCMNHATGTAIEAIYDRHDYVADMLVAYQTLADELDRIRAEANRDSEARS